MESRNRNADKHITKEHHANMAELKGKERLRYNSSVSLLKLLHP